MLIHSSYSKLRPDNKRAIIPIALLVTVAVILLSIPAVAQQDYTMLVLQPKATLPVEAATWTQAPDVPPAIMRKDQRRVVVRWDVTETQAEIAPGVIYDDYWAFQGKVPGPLLRVRVGDLVEVHLTNNIKSQREHNIDFHFVMGPGGGASSLKVLPGETAVLEARAMVPGFFMFHCATSDIPTHIANGMYGFVIVEPEEGLPKVDREFFMVQSEIYANTGKKGHVHFDIARGDKMDAQFVVFNGAVGSMMGNNAPHVQQNSRVRLWVGNAGPNLISSFHVIGQIFDKVYREGDLISPPGRGVQTTLVPAGGSTMVEFITKVPGAYLAVDHAIFRLHQGAAASIVVEGEPVPEIFHPVTASAAKANDMSGHGTVGPPPSDAHAGHTMAAPTAKPPTKPAASKKPNPTSPKNNTYGGIQPLKLPVDKNGIPLPLTSVSAESFGPIPSEDDNVRGDSTVDILNGAGNFDTDPMNDYLPKVLVIRAGSTVTWVNHDVTTHDIRGNKNDFASVLFKPGEIWRHTFTTPGTYQYFCVAHPWMKGTVIVR